jgi:hypothetical protein
MAFIGKELRAIADRNKDSTLIEYLKVITPQWMKDTLGVRGNAQQVHNEQAAVSHAVSEVARRIVTGTGLGGTTDTSVVVNYQAHAKVLTVSDDGSTCSRTQTNR